jgi:hypothetical protein
MTLADIRLYANKYISAMAGDPIDDFFLTFFINKGYVEANRRALAYQQPFSALNTSIGTRTVALPADWIGVRDLFYNGIELDWKPIEMIDLTSSTQGTPRKYAIRENNLMLEPIPDAVVTMSGWYFSDVTPLSAATDTPVFPDEFHQMLVDYGAYEGLILAKMIPAAQVFQKRYERSVGDLAAYYDRDRSRQDILVRRDFERSWDKMNG